MIFKTVLPSQVRAGDRVRYLGNLTTVVGVRSASPDAGSFLVFTGGVVARFVDAVTIVDEARTQAVMARYA